MSRIDRGKREPQQKAYAEWMRPKGGGMAAVSCLPAEETYAELYAYAYVHAVLTFFRRYDAATLLTWRRRKLSAALAACCRLAADKLDETLHLSVCHPIPHMAILLAVPEQKVLLAVLNGGGITIQSGQKPSRFSAGGWRQWLGRRGDLSHKRRSACAVHLQWREPFSTEVISLRTPDDAGNGLSVDGRAPSCQPGETPPHICRVVITGRRHSINGAYCQDFADVRRYDSGAWAAAISDGAGGGSCSEYGALMNVNAFLDAAQGAVDAETLGTVTLQGVQTAYRALCADMPGDAIEPYATLLGVQFRQDMLQYIHIGDGALFARGRDGSVVCLSDAENGHAANRTFFTIERDAAAHLHTGRLDAAAYDKLLLMTDGIYQAYPSAEREAFVSGLFAQSDRPHFDEQMLAALIDTERVLAYGDDHSAVLIDLL